MPVRMSLRDRIAPAYQDLVAGPMERKQFIQEGRRKLLAPAEGRVLEVGAGTGFNLRHYPDTVGDVTLTDELDGMLRRAERRAEEAGRRVETTTAPVERLPFEDGSFDTVVGSLLLCSVDDQDAALAEIRRVLKPGGRYLFLEHIRSDDPELARRQDRWERIWGVVALGCHPNRATLPRIESAFAVEEVEHGELPLGPRIIRPYVLGRAHKPGNAATPV
jgi:ubiquinone/menaquinone biosynthesis C-methylase UbiE